MKYFVISDIHSYYTIARLALQRAGYDENNPEHHLVICGDMFDRGDESWHVFMWVKGLVESGKATLVRGNHEDLLEDCVHADFPQEYDISNGTTRTIAQLASEEKTVGVSDIEVFRACCLACYPIVSWIRKWAVHYLEVGRYIFVHSWIPTIVRDGFPYWYAKSRNLKYYSDWRNATEKDWKSAVWGNPCMNYVNGLCEPNKTIVSGHWHTSWMHAYIEKHNPDYEWGEKADYGIFRSIEGNFVGIDGCTAYSGQCNVLVIADVNKDPNDPINLTPESTAIRPRIMFGAAE